MIDMTEKERASCINTIELLRRLAFNVHGVMDVIDAENCEKIIAMLKQPEPCEDAVSRADVIDMLEMYPFTEYGEYESAREVVKRLPPVTPKRKKGRWISANAVSHGIPFYCSECGEITRNTCMGKPIWNFCPNCGDDMRDAGRGIDEEEQREDSEI